MPATLSLALIAAASLTGPDLAPVLAVESYPTATLAGRHAAAAVLTLVYDPAGHLASCAVEANAGSDFLGSSSCAALRRPQVAPARGADGAPAWSRTRVLVRFFTNDGHDALADEVARLGRGPDLELSARGLPAAREGSAAEVTVAADAAGRITQCAPLAASANPDLARAACASQAAMGLSPLVLADGRQVPFVSTLLVRFVGAH